jgi:hypothetical protein
MSGRALQENCSIAEQFSLHGAAQIAIIDTFAGRVVRLYWSAQPFATQPVAI